MTDNRAGQRTERKRNIDTRVTLADTIEQAKGALAQRLAVDVDVAFDRMRIYAEEQGLGLGDVAQQILNGDSSGLTDVPEQVSGHSRLLSEAPNRGFAKTFSDFAIETTGGLVITWASQSIKRFLGWTPEELVGRPLNEFTQLDAAQELVPAASEGASSAAFGQRTRLRASDGTYKWVTLRKQQILSNTDSAEVLMFSFQHGQHKDSVIEQLSEHEQRLSIILENTSDILIDVGIDGRFHWVSASVTAILGWDPDELTGVVPADLIHPDDLPNLEQAVASAIVGRYTLSDARVAIKGGGYRWVSGVSQEIRDHDDTYRGHVLTLTDVHHRVLAEQRLAANEQQFRHVLENVGDVILRYAPDLTLEWASPSLETVFGWSLSDVVGTAFAMTTPEYGRSTRSALDSAISAGDTQYTNQVRVSCADGSIRWVDSTFRLVRDGNGEHESTIIVLRDSTAQVETEELLHSARNHYRVLVENSTDFVIQSDPSGIVEWVSDSVTHTMGWEVEDLIGTNGFDLVHPEDFAALAGTLELLPHLPGDEITQPWRLRLRNSSGDYHWISYSVRQLFDADGNLTKRISGCQIIDSQVAIEVALEASEEHYRLMAENSSDFVIKTSPKAAIEWVSASVTKTLGWAPHDMIARSRFAFIAPEDRSFALQQSADLGQGEQVACRLRMICADGTVRQLGYAAKPVFNDSNELVAHVGGYRDIEQEVAAEQARLRIEQRLTLTMQSSPVGLALTDLDRKFVEVNPAFCALLNTDSEWLLGRAVSEILPSEVDEVDRLHRETILRGEQESVSMETRIIRPDGTSAWVSRSMALLRTADGAPEAYICQFVDLSEQHAIQIALAHSEQRFRRTMDSATAGLAVVGLNRTFLEANPALHRMLGLEPEWFLDHSIEDILNVGDNVVDLRMRSELRNSPEDHTTRQMRLTHADGTDIWVDHSISTLRDHDGNVISFLSQFVNITETVSKRDELQFQASHDSLTLLANRRALLGRTAKILEHPARTGEQIGVMYCDLDNLKAINDTYGHTAGDQVLVAIANRLVALVRSDDTVARVGGDEFVIALAAVHSMADLENLAERLRGAAAEPVQTDGGSIQPGISIGMALAHRGDQFEAVLQNADLALQQAKLRGGNCAVAYDTSFGRDCPPEVAGDGCRPKPNNA